MHLKNVSAETPSSNTGAAPLCGPCHIPSQEWDPACLTSALHMYMVGCEAAPEAGDRRRQPDPPAGEEGQPRRRLAWGRFQRGLVCVVRKRQGMGLVGHGKGQSGVSPTEP